VQRGVIDAHLIRWANVIDRAVLKVFFVWSKYVVINIVPNQNTATTTPTLTILSLYFSHTSPGYTTSTLGTFPKLRTQPSYPLSYYYPFFLNSFTFYVKGFVFHIVIIGMNKQLSRTRQISFIM
jgi:hypothetical protein